MKLLDGLDGEQSVYILMELQKIYTVGEDNIEKVLNNHFKRIGKCEQFHFANQYKAKIGERTFFTREYSDGERPRPNYDFNNEYGEIR